MDIKVTTWPTTDAVAANELARLKTYVRVEDDGEDDDLKELYLAASQTFTQLTGRSVFTTARRYAVPYEIRDLCVDGMLIELPYPSLLAVQSVKYFDEDHVEQTLTVNTHYITQTVNQIGRVTILPEGLDAMGSLSLSIVNPISVNYTGGYGVDTSFVPLGVKNWIKECVKWMYGVKGVESRDGIPKHLVAMSQLWQLGKVW